MKDVKSSTWNRLCVDQIRACSFNTKSQKIQHASRTTHRKNSKIVCALRACIKRSDEQQVEMKIARMNDSEKNDHTNVDFFASHCVHIKSMLCARSFNLFVNHQTRNHWRKFDLIRVARTIEQRQRNDDSAYENAKNRSAHRFKELSSHISKNLKEETHIQFIHLHLSQLQIVVKDRLIKHEHRTLIDDFCNRIKNKLIEARERRRQREIITSNERKQQWYEKFQNELSSKNKAENTRRLKVYKKIFNVKWKRIWVAYQTKHSRNLCVTLTNDITIRRLKLHEKLTKFESSLAT
jgi:hypothetical protein